MNDIKFEHISIIRVKLDNKHVGDIKEVEGGFAYFPKGKKTHGEVFRSQFEVIASVRGDE